MQLTRHAHLRAAQRQIPLAVVGGLFDFGSDYPSRGATGLRMDQDALERAAEVLSHEEIERLRRFRDAYAVVEGDTVITVARRTRRIH